MKNLLRSLALFVLVTPTIISCSDDDNSASNPGNNTDITIETAKGTYSTTENNKGLFNISLNAADVDFEIAFISDPVADEDLLDAELKSENYVVSAETQMYSITLDSYLTKNSTQSNIISGNLNVILTGEIYSLTGVLTDAENKTYKISYNGPIDIEPIYDVEYEKQNGWYWGDNEYDHPNVAEYMTYFSQGETNNYGELTGDGYYLSLSFFNNMAPKAWEAKVPNQTYTPSTDFEVGTFHIASQQEIDNGAPIYAFASFQHNDSNAGIELEDYITGGTVKVMENDEDQEIRFNIELRDGSRHIGKYVGNVRQGDEYTVSSLVADREVGQLDYGFIEYKGQSPIAGKDNNRWNVYLFNQGVTAYPEYYWSTEGTGDYMRLTIYTESGQTTEIPSGTYPLGVEIAGNAGSGGGFEVGLDYGTWFYAMNADNITNYAPIKTGTVTFAENDGLYTISVVGVDDRENAITANYSGELTFVNNANKPAASAKAKSKKAVGTNKLHSYKKNLKTLQSIKKK